MPVVRISEPGVSEEEVLPHSCDKVSQGICIGLGLPLPLFTLGSSLVWAESSLLKSALDSVNHSHKSWQGAQHTSDISNSVAWFYQYVTSLKTTQSLLLVRVSLKEDLRLMER